jgi:hypothetical protein
MNAHILNDLTHMDPKDVVSAGGKLIIALLIITSRSYSICT